MAQFVPEHDERCGGTDGCGNDRKSESAGFAVKKIKSAAHEKKSEKVKKISYCLIKNNLERDKHKAHTDDYRKSTFESELVFFHFL